MKVRRTAWSSWLSYFTVCPTDETQVVSHGNKHHYTLSQVIVPQENIFERRFYTVKLVRPMYYYTGYFSGNRCG